jgi:2-polyprenyl-3-methyl-5-hydroxy-6-metoxy-1,4-benzoquinol methylase
VSANDISGYEYSSETVNCSHDYLLPTLERELESLRLQEKRAFDLGCGNGAVSHWLATRGFRVAGVDPSTQGLEHAKRAYPDLDLRIGSAYEPLHETFGTFPLVVSLEVVEHLYSPRQFATCVRNLLQPSGYAIISTPYHGYLKNLVMAIAGKLDSHFTALWDHGHIKFWSPRTLRQLFEEAGLRFCRLHRVGRIPPLAKSMVMVVQRPS